MVTSKPSDVGTRVRISGQSHELGFKKCPTSGERLIRGYTKIRLHCRRGKGTAESFSREKNKGSSAEGRWRNPV